MSTFSGKILLRAAEVAQMLSLTEREVYELASAGKLEKRYIGKGTRNFRISAESVEAFAANLPTEPVAEAS